MVWIGLILFTLNIQIHNKNNKLNIVKEMFSSWQFINNSHYITFTEKNTDKILIKFIYHGEGQSKVFAVKKQFIKSYSSIFKFQNNCLIGFLNSVFERSKYHSHSEGCKHSQFKYWCKTSFEIRNKEWKIVTFLLHNLSNSQFLHT